MNSCIACKMPLNDPKEIGLKIADGLVCIHCSTADGKVKSCEEVFEGGVHFFMTAIPGTDRHLAERLTRKNMKELPYWKSNMGACLEGEEATSEEFKAALSKL